MRVFYSILDLLPFGIKFLEINNQIMRRLGHKILLSSFSLLFTLLAIIVFDFLQLKMAKQTFLHEQIYDLNLKIEIDIIGRRGIFASEAFNFRLYLTYEESVDY